MVWGKELYFDATQVKANASLDSSAPRFAVEVHLDKLFTDDVSDEAGLTEGESQLAELPVPLSEAERDQLVRANEERHDWLARGGAPDRTIVRDGYRRRSDFEASTPDPDAALMSDGRKPALGYLDHCAARVRAYQAPASACNVCPIKERCTDSQQGRIFTRSFDEPYLDRVRGYHETAAYRKAMRNRSVWVEPLFGEAKQWHGLRQLRLPGLPKVNILGLLVAAGQNPKRLLKTWGWGRRPWPMGEAGWFNPAPSMAHSLL